MAEQLGYFHVPVGRIAGLAYYFPAGMRDETFIPQCLRFTCLIPPYYQKKTSRLVCTAWRDLADELVHNISIGRELLNIRGNVSQYSGCVFDEAGKIMFHKNGEPRRITKLSYQVISCWFGNEAKKHIAVEIMEGRRPHTWNITNRKAWNQSEINRCSKTYEPGMEMFGFARVLERKRR